jgi:hypothetical protein
LRKWLFARWYNKIMEKYEAYISQRKLALFADLPTTVMEIGPGTGANLGYLSQGCKWIGIEPNPYMHPQLREKAASHGVEAEFRVATVYFSAVFGSRSATGIERGSSCAQAGW